MIKIQCTTCKKYFSIPVWRKNKAKFCSRSCIRVSNKTRKKMSESRIGIPKSSKWKKNMSISKLGERNPMWKGNKAGLDAIHTYIHSRYPKPKTCEICKKSKPIDLANISQHYKRELTDWEWLCRRCHMVKDGRINNLKQYYK